MVARVDSDCARRRGRGAFAKTRAKGRTKMLRIYGVAVRLLVGLRPAIERIERRDRDLGRQLRRAGASVLLNLGEVAPGKAWEEEA